MSKPVIQAEGISKHYRLGAIAGKTLREDLANWWQSRREQRKKISPTPNKAKDLWALRDVNFSVNEGEIVGIVGRNGAGKSTLLKILSRISAPTSGHAKLLGRLGCLLEVGTGFHPELTGRENIFLNGAILGMRRREIDRKIDEIIEFSSMARFIDTPVKRYSSGMAVRLAFAIAAHLDTDILIVDEVLAVGDQAFQKKCIERMGQLSGLGRTVLIVSHQLPVITRLCARSILLRDGSVECDGPTRDVLAKYLEDTTHEHLTVTREWRGGSPKIVAAAVCEKSARRGDLKIFLEYKSEQGVKNPIGGVVIYDRSGAPVWGSNGRFHEVRGPAGLIRQARLTVESKGIPVLSGRYSATLWLADHYGDLDCTERALVFDIGDESVADERRPAIETVGSLQWPAVWYTEERNEDQRTASGSLK